MKITIRDSKDQKEATMELWLEKYSHGDGAMLKGMCSNGQTWTLLDIKEGGIHMFTGISADTGWPLESIKGNTKTIKLV